MHLYKLCRRRSRNNGCSYLMLMSRGTERKTGGPHYLFMQAEEKNTTEPHHPTNNLKAKDGKKDNSKSSIYYVLLMCIRLLHF